MSAADYRLMTEATGVRIAEALEDVTAMAGPKGDPGDVSEAELTAKLADKADVIVDTASGAIASFPDGAAVAAKDITIGIEPVQSGSGDPSPENVRPISGWTGANVTRTGKNVYKMRSTSTSASGITTTANSDGTLSISGTTGDSAYSVGLIDPALQSRISELLAKGGTFCMSMNKGTYNSTTLNVSLSYKETADGPNKFITPTGNPVTIPAGSIWGGTSQLWIPANTTIQTLDHWFIQLEEASTPSTPVPYTGTTIPISWQSVAGTVYGGTLDVTTGLLTVNMRYLRVLGDQQSNWFREKTGTETSLFALDPGAQYRGVTHGDTIKPNLISTFLQTTTAGSIWANETPAITTKNDGSRFWVRAPGCVTVSEIYDYLGNNPLYACYELATPQTYQLTPTEVEMLLGENNVWADTGDSTVVYRADTKLYIQKINAPTDDDMIADTQIASGRYFIVGGNLYRSTTTIPAGDAINPGSNCILTNLADALNALNT